jgi:hypothetical protein
MNSYLQIWLHWVNIFAPGITHYIWRLVKTLSPVRPGPSVLFNPQCCEKLTLNQKRSRRLFPQTVHPHPLLIARTQVH